MEVDGAWVLYNSKQVMVVNGITGHNIESKHEYVLLLCIQTLELTGACNWSFQLVRTTNIYTSLDIAHAKAWSGNGFKFRDNLWEK